ncbi:serine/threonine-protein kinase [Actinomadura kijaniata]|uniref:serine/threonine-protein kinase n=1 Tax=Actinomadura kijaniata TaxID=46161 RepID=UPI003F1CDC1A
MTTGTRLLAGRYRLDARLGQGGMGIVWRATDLELRRPVAVKELLLPDHLSPAARENAAQRAMREARAAALLRHPSIVAVHDVVMDEGRPCIVMDLLAGRSLDRVAGEGPLPPERVARIGLEILSALRLAHENGVLHRDVKPANVFLHDDGRAILTDFGIAALEGDATLTETGTLVGTPAFMAPEQVKHEGMGPAADLWSLGATLYALVEGRPPFQRSTMMGMLTAVLTEPPEPPRRAGPLTPAILALLNKNPAVRLDADGLEGALRAVAAGAEPPPVPVPLPPGPPPPRRRGRALPLLLAAAVAVAAVLAVVLWPDGGGTPAPRPGVTGSRPATASEPATASGPATTAPATTAPARPAFTAVPRACSLLSAETVARLVPEPSAHPNRDGPQTQSCVWMPGGSGGRTLRTELRVVSSVPAAHDRFAEEYRTVMPASGTVPAYHPARPLNGLGDEAFVHYERDTSPIAFVVFRRSNLIAEVSYETEDEGRSRAGAQRAARLILVALDKSR